MLIRALTNSCEESEAEVSSSEIVVSSGLMVLSLEVRSGEIYEVKKSSSFFFISCVERRSRKDTDASVVVPDIAPGVVPQLPILSFIFPWK